MAENNAVTKDELKEVVEELRQEFRQGLAETNQNVLVIRHKVDGLEKKVDANDQKLEAFRAETLARFDTVDEKHDAVVKAIFDHQKKTDSQYEGLHTMLSKLMTGMDAEMKEHEIIRHEQLSLGVIQDRHGRDIEAIKKHVGFESNNGKRPKNNSKKQLLKRNKKSK